MHQRQFGYDIRRAEAATIDACKEACASDALCKAATYEANKSSCYLHNALRSTSSAENFDHIVKITCTGKFFGRVVQLLSALTVKMRIKSSYITFLLDILWQDVQQCAI